MRQCGRRCRKCHRVQRDKVCKMCRAVANVFGNRQLKQARKEDTGKPWLESVRRQLFNF